MMDFTLHYPDYARVLDGDVLSALMLSRIVYWYMPDAKGQSKLRVLRYGKLWLVKSWRDWEAELGLSQKQSGRCLQVLRQRGFITTITAKFNVDTVTHIRVVGLEGKETLESPEALFKIANVAFQNRLEDIPLTETTAETTTKTTTEKKPAMPSAYATALSTSTPTPEAVPPTPPTPPSPAGNEVTPAKGVSKLAQMKSGMKEPGVPTKNSLVTLWQQVQAGTSGKHHVNVTGKERGQLKKVADKIGPDTSKVIRWVLEDWTYFAEQAKTLDGVATYPHVPKPGFLLAHADVALTLWQKWLKKQEGGIPPTGIVKPQKFKIVKTVEKPATKEEILAILQEELREKEQAK